MAYVHVAHDCVLGEHVLISNGTQLAGHVIIEDHVTISGLVAIHQFERLGTYAFIGGGSRVTQDVPPYVKAVGNPMKFYGLNSVGLRRAGFPEATVLELKRAYRLCFNSSLNTTQAVAEARAELQPLPEVVRFLDFLEQSQRGVGS
jgi:UDP-N-acetylglucosamine acyltransferase